MGVQVDSLKHGNIDRATIYINRIDEISKNGYGFVMWFFDLISDFVLKTNNTEINNLASVLCSDHHDSKDRISAFNALFELAGEAGKGVFSGSMDEDNRAYVLKAGDFEFSLPMEGHDRAEQVAGLIFGETRAADVVAINDLLSGNGDNRGQVLAFLDLRTRALPVFRDAFDVRYDGNLDGSLVIRGVAEFPLAGIGIDGDKSYVGNELIDICHGAVRVKNNIVAGQEDDASQESGYVDTIKDFFSRDDAPFPLAGEDHQTLVFEQIQKDIGRGDYYVGDAALARPDIPNDPVHRATALTDFCGMLRDIGCSREQRNVILSTCHQELFALVMHATQARNGGPLRESLAPVGEQDNFSIRIAKAEDGAVSVDAFVAFSPSLSGPIGDHLAGIMQDAPEASPWQRQGIAFTIGREGTIAVNDVQVRTLTVPPPPDTLPEGAIRA
ncbi:hypothetical protein ACUSIJ_21030 [Pseudochelatococcus sp. B33]